MFSAMQKRKIAAEVEKVLLSFGHPEMPKERPVFFLRVDGKEDWNFASIQPNWMFDDDNPPSVNPFNEIMAKHSEKENG